MAGPISKVQRNVRRRTCQLGHFPMKRYFLNSGLHSQATPKAGIRKVPREVMNCVNRIRFGLSYRFKPAPCVNLDETETIPIKTTDDRMANSSIRTNNVINW